jgi:hypothetical protein
LHLLRGKPNTYLLAFGVRYMVLGDRCIRGKMGFI